MACRTSFLSRQRDVIASFSFGACAEHKEFYLRLDFWKFGENFEGSVLETLLFASIKYIDHYVFSVSMPWVLWTYDGGL